MRILTDFVYPPIPIRKFDWSAIDGDTYDGEGCPVGYGATEQEAIDDLLSQTCKNNGADVGPTGGCRYCPAEQGEACRAAKTKAKDSTQ